MPTPRQLETFLAVIDFGSIRAAADYLDVSQPTVSKQMAAMERKLGMPVLERRRGSRATPTAAGALLVNKAREALQAQRNIVSANRPSRRLRTVTVLVRPHLFHELEPWIDDFRLPSGQAEVRLEILSNQRNLDLLLAEDPTGIALIRSLTPLASPPLKSMLLLTDSCSLYASPGCIAEYGELSAMPVIVPQSGTLRDWELDHLRAAGIGNAHTVATSPFTGLLLRHTLEGRGAGIFMDTHVAPHVERGELVPLKRDLARMYLQIVWHPQFDQGLAEDLYAMFHSTLAGRARNEPPV
jgi:DNA-binding transcriptional LysR family regulator